MFEKKQRVFDVRWGWGKVVRVGHFDGFPVRVEFESGRFGQYSVDGYISIDSQYPSLFPENHPVTIGMQTARRPEGFVPGMMVD